MLWVLLTVVALLALCGAGLIPGILPACSVALAATVALGLGDLRGRQRALFWFTVVWLLITGATLLPLPSFLVGARRSESFDAVAELGKRFQQAATPDIADAAADAEQLRPQSHVPRRLSLNAPGTARYLYLFVGAWAAFWAVGTSSVRRRLRFTKILVLLGCGVGVTAVIGRYVIPQNDWLLWWYPVPETEATKTMGPFINRNHFATFIAMLAPLAFAMALPETRNKDWRHARRETPLLARIGWVLLMAVLAACVFLSLSRGGVCALLAGIAVTAAYWLRSDRRIATVAAVVGVAAFVALALWPDRALQARFQTLREKDTPDTARLLIWRQSVKLWQRYPLWGCGYNAYHTVPHPDSRLPLGKTATHSESDYFQNLSEGGLVGVGFALAFVILAGTVAYRTIRPKRTVRRTEHEDEIREDSDETVNAERQARTHRPSHGRQPVLPDNLASGALGALTALAVHALVDVPLRVPLDAFVAAAVAGLIMPPRDSRTRFPNWPDEALHERLVMAGVALLACIAFLGQPGQEALYSDTVRAESSDHPAELLSALKASPDYWYLWALINQRLQETARQANSPEEADALKQTALFALGRACEVNPQSPALLGELAARRWEAGRFDDAREAYWRLFETVPEEPTIWIDWMRVEWISGNRHAARAIPRRADEIMDLPRNRVTLWKELAALEATRGSIQRMLDALRNGAAAVPDDPDIRWSIAVCERELGYRDEEQQTVTRITQLDPKDWRAWWRLAQIQAQNKDGAAVNRALNKAVNLNPSLRSQAADLWTDMTSD